MNVVDSKSKRASLANCIEVVDGDRGGVAIHQYSPRFSVILIFWTLSLVSCKEKISKEKTNKAMNNLQEAQYNIDDIGDGNKYNYDRLY
jgi:hypothetical protein